MLHDRAAATSISLSRIHAGSPANYASEPPRIWFGPLWPLVRLDGSLILWSDVEHPYYHGKRQYLAEEVSNAREAIDET